MLGCTVPRTTPTRASLATGDRCGALYIMAVNIGLRKGELLGLRWQDADLDTATMWVRRTLAKVMVRVGAPAPIMG